MTQMPSSAETISQRRAAKAPSNSSELLRYRCMILYRFVLALLGGYALAASSAMLIAQIFAQAQSSAAMSATLIGMCIHCAAFIWVFMRQSTLQASLGIVIPCAVFFIVLKFLGH